MQYGLSAQLGQGKIPTCLGRPTYFVANRKKAEMVSLERMALRRIYKGAAEADRLPWHHKEPTTFLSEVVQSREKPGRALDIGCGSGIDSVYLASQGWDVTSLDFIPDALTMTRTRADAAGVTLNLIEADAMTWSCPADSFDLIIDGGCLHSKKQSDRPKYKANILNWLAKGGDYVLIHFEKRHSLDWRPIGPRRVSRENILAFLTPELVEKTYKRTVLTGQVIIMGPTITYVTYWFQKKI